MHITPEKLMVSSRIVSLWRCGDSLCGEQ